MMLMADLNQMAVDNTPTVKSRLRKPKTTRARIRLETAKQLNKLGSRAKTKTQRFVQGSAKADVAAEAIHTIVPKPKTEMKPGPGLLAKPPKPSTKFRKRQVHKTWLPTHLFHAKRAHITDPKHPLWRLAIPLTPTEKSYRPTHRASSARGAVAWDTSYMATIGLEGKEEAIEKVLRCLGVSYAQAGEHEGTKAKKWREGRRACQSWTSQLTSDTGNEIAQVTVVWCTQTPRHERASPMDGQPELDGDTEKAAKVGQGKVFIRVHPSAFLELWSQVLLSAKTQHPAVKVEDLRFEIGSIEIIGPGSTEALLGTLKPSAALDQSEQAKNTPQRTWTALEGLTNPASLPADVILGFCVQDPRLHHPLRAATQHRPVNLEDHLLGILSDWPPDHGEAPVDLFDGNARSRACRELPSQKSINRRKGLALAGTDPAALSTDPKIPVMLLASRRSAGGQGAWIVLLPWRCVRPVWYTLMHCPLASGAKVRFGGMRETRQVVYEAGKPWFPGDFPGTNAGWQWEIRERDQRKKEWDKRPKSKRTEWTSVNLGDGRRGEFGSGWACDWEQLMQGWPKEAGRQAARGLSRDCDGHGTSTSAKEAPSLAARSTVKMNGLPPFGLHQVPLHIAAQLLEGRASTLGPSVDDRARDSGLATIKIKLVNRGTPTACARIYQLPSKDAARRQRWLQVRGVASSESTAAVSNASRRRGKGASLSEQRRALAASILEPVPLRDGHKRANEADYPTVPDEEDLIGFVTTGAFSLAGGQGVGIGSVLLGKVVRSEAQASGRGPGNGERSLCVVREAGKGIGRLGRWELV